MAIDSARSMKKILRFLFGLLINVCILFVLVKGFSYSFDFAYLSQRMNHCLMWLTHSRSQA